MYALAHQRGERIINEAMPGQPPHAPETLAHDVDAEMPAFFGTCMACVQMAVVIDPELFWVQGSLQTILYLRSGDRHVCLATASLGSGNTCLLM